jgi:hypothetical protein
VRWAFIFPPPPKDYQIAELVLHSGARVNRFEEKAAFNPMPDLYQFATANVTAADAIQKKDVVDLTSKMHPDGTLDWTPPPGNWVVLRFGYSLLGITNHPATEEATGLEVDKLNSTYVRNYMDHYLDSYKSTVSDSLMGKRGVKYVITDSWEAGAQNWTDDMIAEFTKRRGYDPRPWMPVLTGHVVESAQASDAFLWDLRKTIADLTADEHYGQVEASIQSPRNGPLRRISRTGARVHRRWHGGKETERSPDERDVDAGPGVNKEQYGYNADDRESASVAHIYGQNIAAAESMTAMAAPWAWSPETLKPTADKELAEGINRFVIHCSVHQPLIGKVPGLGLGPFGQWFTRNETWAEEAGSLGDLPGPELVPAAAGTFRRGCSLLLWRGLQRHRDLRQQVSRCTCGLRLRLCKRGCFDSQARGQGRQHHDGERHELSRARARSVQRPHVLAGLAKYSCIGKSGRSGCRSKTCKYPEPGRQCG